MAKKKRKPDIHFVPDGKTLVRSYTYGPHLRDERGTHTATALNDVLTTNQDLTPVVNATAKLVNDPFKVYANHFKQGNLWSKILGRMRKAQSSDRAVLFASLTGLPLNERYPLDYLSNARLGTIEVHKKTLTVPLHCHMAPRFKDTSDCFYFETLVLFFGKGFTPGTCAVDRTAWMPRNAQPGLIEFKFTIPARVTHYVICVKLAGGIGGRASDTLASMGIDVMGSGVV